MFSEFWEEYRQGMGLAAGHPPPAVYRGATRSWSFVQQPETDRGIFNLPLGILMTALGSFGVYGYLFATGYWIYGRIGAAMAWAAVAAVCTVLLLACWKQSARHEEKFTA